ncbi:RING finger protein 150-like [Babylonia areolata]|uniref:RING finger protein 150-like n=1 Tax=Babylonia areolata TaxID=304850 RepID=UPI003FD2E8B6
MAWILKSMLMILCMRMGEAGLSIKEAKLLDKAAEISVSMMDTSSGRPYNTTYMFGVFGENSLKVPASGQLVHVRSEGNVNDGCNDYNHDLPTHDWVALIERGTCYFNDKVRTATKQYNASAVVIYNNQPSNHLVMMHSSVKDEVYVFVAQSYGRQLALLVDNGVHVQVNITAVDVSSASIGLYVTSTRSSLLVSLAAASMLLCREL